MEQNSELIGNGIIWFKNLLTQNTAQLTWIKKQLYKTTIYQADESFQESMLYLTWKDETRIMRYVETTEVTSLMIIFHLNQASH